MELLISPSILSANFARLDEQIKAAEQGGADWLHVDVMDGHFVPNLTIGPQVVHDIREVCSLPLDVHLMIEKPHTLAEQFVDAGGDYITVHVEADGAMEAIELIKSRGKKAGIAINPTTSHITLEPYLERVDMVVVMTVNPGFGGQRFMPEVLPKLSTIKKMMDMRGLTAYLEVDGGIKRENAGEVVKAGANVLVAGSAVFKGRGSIEENITDLREAAQNALKTS